MKLKHPLTGAIYTLQDDGLIRVEVDGRSGLFHPDGRYKSGDVRDADPHLIGWIGGPQLQTRGPLGSSRVAQVPRREDPPRTSTRRSKGMDLGLNGRKAIVTAASRGIGLSIARTLADDGVDVAICARSEGGLETAKKDLEEVSFRDKYKS